MNNKYNKLLKIIVLFTISFIIGYIIGLRSEEQSLNLENINNLNGFISFFKITIKNTIAFILLFSSLILGEGIVYFFYVLNAYIIGLVMAKINSIISIIIILPHGILEMTFYILTGYLLLNYIDTSNPKYIKFTKLTYLGILFAAAIESFITPKLTLMLLS